MIIRFFHDAYAPILALAASALALSGCSEEAPANPTPNSKVDVPEIPATVTAEDFCKLFDGLRCAGAFGCCSTTALPFADEAECLAASTCATDIDAVLASSLVASGAVMYDATLAADYLRARATSTSDCSGESFESPSLQLFAGALTEGADCSASVGDIAHKYVCKPGLACRLREDAATGAEVHTCAPLAATTDSACKVDADCESGACIAEKCAADTTALFCQVPTDPEPAANWDTLGTEGVPQKLRVMAHHTSGSGTSNDIKLLYRNKTATYACTITETIATGGYQECVPSQSSNNTSNGDQFYVKYANSNDNNDGLRVTQVAVQFNGTLYTLGTFDVSDMAIDCEGCTDNFDEGYCNSCWIDDNDHGHCTEMKINMSTQQIWCP